MKKSIYIYNNGELCRKDNTIRYITLEGQKRDIPIEIINDIYIMGASSFNTNIINYLSQYGIIVHFFNYYHFYTGSFFPREQLLAGNLLVKQVNFYTDYNERMAIAKEFIRAASENIYRNLRYYNGRGKDVSSSMHDIEIYKNHIDECQTIEELMGIEGNIRSSYYDAWPIIINQSLEFRKRVYNPPDNEMNSLISFCNSLVYSKILSEVYKTQLNPTISYLHSPGYRRFSLCLDISEIFKPLISDRLIFSLLNRNQITEESFDEGLQYLHIKKKASECIVREFEKKMQTTIKHKHLNKRVSYQYLIRLECYKIIKHLLGEKKYEAFKIWW